MTQLDLFVIENEELEDTAAMATLEHEHIAVNIITELGIFLKARNLGQVFGAGAEYRFLAEVSPEEAGQRRKSGKQPDISFVLQENLPVRLRSYPDLVPDFVVEISSPTDKDYEIGAKVALYQKYGVKLIWVVHPYTRIVDVYRLASGIKPELYSAGEELGGDTLLPGFKLPVSAIFNYPPDPDPVPDPKPRSKSAQ